MLQHDTPDDFVVATGTSYSVREFLEEAAQQLDMNWKQVVKIDSRYLRPSEVDFLQGDPGKAERLLKWKPKTSFKELVKMMVEHDFEQARQECTLRDAGHNYAVRSGAAYA